MHHCGYETVPGGGMSLKAAHEPLRPEATPRSMTRDATTRPSFSVSVRARAARPEIRTACAELETAVILLSSYFHWLTVDHWPCETHIGYQSSYQLLHNRFTPRCDLFHLFPGIEG